jgi:hypothetical protein
MGVTDVLLAAEQAFNDAVRAPNRNLKPLALLLCSLVIFSACLPLVITGTISFWEADEICRDRRSQIPKERDATSTIFPLHGWNVMAMISSLVFALIWLYFCPHRLSHHQQILDKTRE